MYNEILFFFFSTQCSCDHLLELLSVNKPFKTKPIKHYGVKLNTNRTNLDFEIIHLITLLIKTITKSSNVIGYQQPNIVHLQDSLSVMLVIGQCNNSNKTVYASFLCTPFARAAMFTIQFILSSIAAKKVNYYVIVHEDVLPMVILFLKFCHGFDLLVTGLRVFQFCLQ